MSRLVETIKIVNREPQNLEYHQKRVDSSRFNLFGLTNKLDLRTAILLPEDIESGIYKCRVFYDKQIHLIEFEKYKVRKIMKLHVVESSLNYDYKFADRKKIDELKNCFPENDDILITHKGLFRDASYANICLWDGDKWFTPQNPLLKGTKRQKLLDVGEIFEKEISVYDLEKYEKICLINAMLDLEELTIKIKDVLL